MNSNQLLDYFIGEEILLKFDPEWTDSSSRRWNTSYKEHIDKIERTLKQYNVNISRQKILARSGDLIKGRGVFKPLGDYNGTPGTREGKDQSYAAFWALVDVFIPRRWERSYLGLAANQLDVIRTHIGLKTIVVVERDKDKAEAMKTLAERCSTERWFPQVEIRNEDIFDVMMREENRFNVLDLDLMTFLPEDSIDWAKAIMYCTVDHGPTVVNITTCIGRIITAEQYRKNVETLKDNLGKVGISLVGKSSFGYKDRVIPMRSEKLILTKE